jgi:hypothetical protein
MCQQGGYMVNDISTVVILVFKIACDDFTGIKHDKLSKSFREPLRFSHYVFDFRICCQAY